MSNQCAKLLARSLVFLGVVLFALNAHTQEYTVRGHLYADQDYQQLAPDSPDQTIAVGTKITIENWQKYQQFLPVSLRTMFAGDFNWKIGSPTDYFMNVGPTTTKMPPRGYRQDTEQFGGQAQVKILPSGGPTLINYTAGAPFPKPEEPYKAEKIFFDDWLAWRPFLFYTNYQSAKIDTYFGLARSGNEVENYRLDHLSDPPYPRTLPERQHVLTVSTILVTFPEQSKYTGQVSLYSDDPNRVQELFSFVPSLRRIVRLSAAARCSPQVGTDLFQDDGIGGVAFLPGSFTYKFLGDHKILAVGNFKPGTGQSLDQYTLGAPLPAWPKTYTWELRPVWIIDVEPLPGLKNTYCYGHKVLYVDKQTHLNDWFEDYDGQGKLWKTEILPDTLFPHRGEMVDAPALQNLVMWDLQNSHASITFIGNPVFDENAPKSAQDYLRMSSPQYLVSIMR